MPGHQDQERSIQSVPWEPFSEAPETSGACRTPLLNIRFVFSVRCRRTQSFQGIERQAKGAVRTRGPAGRSCRGRSAIYKDEEAGEGPFEHPVLAEEAVRRGTRSMRSRYTRQASRKVETVQGKSVHQKTRGMHHKNSSLQSSCDTFLHQKDTKKTAQNFTFD